MGLVWYGLVWYGEPHIGLTPSGRSTWSSVGELDATCGRVNLKQKGKKEISRKSNLGKHNTIKRFGMGVDQADVGVLVADQKLSA